MRKSIGLLRGLKRKRSLSTEVLDFVSLNLSHSIALNELYRNHDKHLQQEIVARKKLEDKIKAVTSIEKTMEQRSTQAKVQKNPVEKD